MKQKLNWGISIFIFLIITGNQNWADQRKQKKKRKTAAEVITRRISEILINEPEAEIIIAGDLNENIDEYIRNGREYMTALFPESEYSTADNDTLLFLQTKWKNRIQGRKKCILYSLERFREREVIFTETAGKQ